MPWHFIPPPPPPLPIHSESPLPSPRLSTLVPSRIDLHHISRFLSADQYERLVFNHRRSFLSRPLSPRHLSFSSSPRNPTIARPVGLFDLVVFQRTRTSLTVRIEIQSVLVLISSITCPNISILEKRSSLTSEGKRVHRRARALRRRARLDEHRSS